MTAESGAWTCYLDIDVTGQGVYHLPGDRVGVLAENDQDLVHRTVAEQLTDHVYHNVRDGLLPPAAGTLISDAAPGLRRP